MLRIALRVRLRFRSAQDDTETKESGKMKVKKQSLRHAIACHLPLHKGGGKLSLLQTRYNV